ncbi:PRC-barrel domain-containing protein [Alkalinema sp. FACHB-956]|uniref:PRC-barrel domain-containing protein n=1 Tax=Alkalinema sp. FACHB-956 TaxID=2692768 RepID=UPI00168200AE|nr:PRC-barrel domain-containing protein [Alkalinema sp. FACHB-956]MBD2328869.1 PRC-barrel domain-containing protein [Alkalinema sp. FACHB-956]
MTAQPDYIKQSELLDQLVLDRASMEELGRVEVLWSYPKLHRVLGFICKSGFMDRRKTAFNLDQLDRFGTNGVLVNSAPVETDRDRVRQLESLINCEVWTDEGNKIGKIVDYMFDLKTGNIRQYLMAGSGLQGLTGKIYALYPSQILSLGSTRVMVSEAIADGLDLYKPGLEQKLEEKLKRANELLTEEKSQAKEGLQSLFQKAKTVTSQVKDQVTDQVKERAKDLREVTEQVREKAQDLLEEVPPLLDELEPQIDRWRSGTRGTRSEGNERYEAGSRYGDRDDRSEGRYPDQYDDRRDDFEDEIEFDFDAWVEEEQQQRQPIPQRQPSRQQPQQPSRQQFNPQSEPQSYQPPQRQPSKPSDQQSNPQRRETAAPTQGRSDQQFTAQSRSNTESTFTAQPRPQSQAFTAKPQPRPDRKPDAWDDDDSWLDD